jgi:hypothetical protein
VKIEELPEELLDELLDEDAADTTPYNGQVCEHCGWCDDPSHCVWGVQCPKCYAPPREQCTDDRGGLTGLHQERWDYAGKDWRR